MFPIKSLGFVRVTFHSSSHVLTGFDKYTNCKFTLSSLFLKYFIHELAIGTLWFTNRITQFRSLFTFCTGYIFIAESVNFKLIQITCCSLGQVKKNILRINHLMLCTLLSTPHLVSQQLITHTHNSSIYTPRWFNVRLSFQRRAGPFCKGILHLTL